MRKINKTEINVYMLEHHHKLIGDLRETGINLSSFSRMAIRKHGDTPLDLSDELNSKKVRVSIYLDQVDRDRLDSIAGKEGISASDALRKLISSYLQEKERALRQLL